jgi:hypothetical protein
MPLADFAADQRELQRDFPSMLVHSGRRISCTATDITQQVNADENGITIPKAFDVIAVLSDFSNVIPAQRETVTLDDVTYQVGNVETDKHTDSIRFFLHKS